MDREERREILIYVSCRRKREGKQGVGERFEE